MVICANCYEQSEATEFCEQCGSSPRLNGDYLLEEVVSEAAHGITFRARRADDDHFVAIQQFLLPRAGSGNALEQLRREASPPESSGAPTAPAEFDSFSIVSGPAVAFYLVREWGDGEGVPEMDLTPSVGDTVAPVERGPVAELLSRQRLLPQATALDDDLLDALRQRNDTERLLLISGGFTLLTFVALFATSGLFALASGLVVFGGIPAVWWWTKKKKLARLRREALLQNGSLAPGKVTSARPHESGMMYEYRYEIPVASDDGLRPVYEDSVSSSEVLGLRTGSRVLVAFNPEAPSENLIVAIDA